MQLSTDKNNFLFPLLENEKNIDNIKQNENFIKLLNISTLSLIYDEKNKKFNILIFDKNLFLNDFTKIVFIDNNIKKRKHPIFVFQNNKDEYISECRYGGKTANALQRGLWTHTVKSKNYFRSITNGWKKYNINKNIKKLFSKSLISTQDSHIEGIELFQKDINYQKSKIEE